MAAACVCVCACERVCNYNDEYISLKIHLVNELLLFSCSYLFLFVIESVFLSNLRV